MFRTCLSLAFLAMATAASAQSLTLSPKYDAVGTNPDGSKYSGTVTLQPLSDTTIAIQWTIGRSVFKGFAMRRNDTIAATYTLNGEPGLIIYKVDGNSLDALWAVRGMSGNGTERLTPSK
jgi:hypothetical protein